MKFAWLLPLVLALGPWAQAQAQTFKMPCEVTATIPAADDLKLPPETATMEIQGMGKNIFMRVNGSKYYNVTVNSLVTDEFVGKDLTTNKEMGAHRRFLKSGLESEIRIARQTVYLHAFHDTDYQGKRVRVFIEGPCKVVTQ